MIGQTAAREFEKALDDLDRHSAGGAGRVLDAIDACVQRLSRFPESSPVDASAPAPLLQGAPTTKGRRTHAEGFSIRYAFPVEIKDDVDVVVILSIRHGKRRPLGDREYLRRFLAEIVQGRKGRSV